MIHSINTMVKVMTPQQWQRHQDKAKDTMVMVMIPDTIVMAKVPMQV